MTVMRSGVKQTDFLKQFHAIHMRHFDITEHQVVAVLFQQAECFQAITGNINPEPTIYQDPLDYFKNCRFIIYDKNFCHLWHILSLKILLRLSVFFT